MMDGEGVQKTYLKELERLNLNEDDKEYFDSLVRDEMEKLESEFRVQMAKSAAPNYPSSQPSNYATNDASSYRQPGSQNIPADSGFMSFLLP